MQKHNKGRQGTVNANQETELKGQQIAFPKQKLSFGRTTRLKKKKGKNILSNSELTVSIQLPYNHLFPPTCYDVCSDIEPDRL